MPNFILDSTINSLMFAVIGGLAVAIVNYVVRKKERKYFEVMEQRRKSYSELLNNIQGFLIDPAILNKLEMKQHFMRKFYNEIWLHASPSVIKKMNKFFQTITVQPSTSDEKKRALGETMLAIRKSLGSKNSDFLFFNRLAADDYQIYSATIINDK